MNIVFAEPLGMCEHTFNKKVKNLKKQGHNIIFHPDRDENEEVMIERAKQADILVVSNIPLRKNFFDACPNLKMVAVAFTGVDHIDIDTCKQRGITVCNAAGYSTQAVAELSICMMLAVYRQIIGGNTVTRLCKSYKDFFPGNELYGKTVGIIGLGAIGQRVAQLAHAFGCNILAYNRSPKNIEYVSQVSKEELLKQADIVSVHLPLTPETRNFIDATEFKWMRTSAILINTARGPIVNSKALYYALCSKQISGAAVDVYDQEPPLPSDEKLLDAPNLLMLPHIGYATEEAFVRRLDIVTQNIEKWLIGTPQNLIV